MDEGEPAAPLRGTYITRIIAPSARKDCGEPPDDASTSLNEHVRLLLAPDYRPFSLQLLASHWL